MTAMIIINSTCIIILLSLQSYYTVSLRIINDYISFLLLRLVGVFRMVLQRLIQEGHLEVVESLVDMNNTVLKVKKQHILCLILCQ